MQNVEGLDEANGGQRGSPTSTSSEQRPRHLRSLVTQVTAPDPAEPFGVYLFGSHEPGAELGRYVERTVFLEAFGNTPELLAAEYAPYEEASVFVCVVDHVRKLPAGVIRIILPSVAGFKSLNDLEPDWGEPAEVAIERTNLAMDPHKTWDIATLAVLPEYRGKALMGLVALGLYQAVSMLALNRGIEWLVAILDAAVYRLIRWRVGLPFAGYKGIAQGPYMGTPANLPVWCNIPEAEKIVSESDPLLYQIMTGGTGLEPALRRLDVASSKRLVA